MIVTVSRGKERTYMKTFTIDTDNNITVHSSRKAARETGAGVFATEEQFADLIGSDNKRLVEIWNGLAAGRSGRNAKLPGSGVVADDTFVARIPHVEVEPQTVAQEAGGWICILSCAKNSRGPRR